MGKERRLARRVGMIPARRSARHGSCGLRFPAARGALEDADSLFQSLAQEVEEGLRDIDFDEVTTEDRIAFIEAAVSWQVRQALLWRRLDLAARLQRFGAELAAQLDRRSA
jgi:hypothetical protein